MSDGVDFAQLMEGLAELREVLNATVQALKMDGFTEDQARELTVALFKSGMGSEGEAL